MISGSAIVEISTITLFAEALTQTRSRRLTRKARRRVLESASARTCPRRVKDICLGGCPPRRALRVHNSRTHTLRYPRKVRHQVSSHTLLSRGHSTQTNASAKDLAIVEMTYSDD